MDARMQKHRMTRWVGRFLALLSLAKSCRVQATELLGSSGKRSKDPNNIFALGNLVRALVGLFLSSISVQAGAAWDAGAAGCFTSFQTAMAAVCAINNPDSTSIPGSVYYRDSCVMTSIPNFTVYAHAVDLATGNSFSFAYTLSLTQCDFTITLDQKSATLEPGTAAQNVKTFQEFTATVTSNKNVPKAGAKVTIKADVKQGKESGGHDHTDTIHRPKGYLGRDSSATLCDPNAAQPQACITGATDANGKFTFVFTSPEPSGEHTITATCDVCKGNEDKAVIAVKVSGLVSLSANSTDYVLVGDTPTHSDNHYLTPSAKTLAERLAIEYRKKFPKAPRLHFNDASLKEGGVLDICTGIETSAGCATASYQHYVPMCQLQPNGTYSCSWARPHIEHRRGSVIDVRANNVDSGADNYATSIPRRNEKEFLSIAKDMGLNPGRPHSPKSSNRHWHIRLLGVAE